VTPEPTSSQPERDRDDSSPPTLGQAAVRYARAGWPVLPLHDSSNGMCSCAAGPDCRKPGKHPRTINGYRDATTDPARAGIWWTRWPNANIGVATGQPSGLVVVDLDGEPGHRSWARLIDEHGPVPETATVATPHGTHLWYRLPSGLAVPRRIGALGEGVDVLGDGGYVVVPPSRIPATPQETHEPESCGDGYVWTRRVKIAVLPAWVADLAHEHTRVEQQHSAEEAGRQPFHSSPDGQTSTPMREEIRGSGRKGYGQAAIDGEAARVASAQPGRRNDTLNAAAWRLGRLAGAGELDPRHATRALWEAARGCGLVDDDGAAQVRRTIDSGLQAGMKQPRTRNTATDKQPSPVEEHRDCGGRHAGQRNLGITL
jgi:Bifunctional DNA primase/polymerase, N-terminal